MIIVDKLKKYALFAGSAVVGGFLIWGNYQVLDAKNDKITALNKNIVTITAERDALEKVIKDKLKSDKVTEKVVEVVQQKETKQEKAKSQAATYVNNKLAEIEKKYAAKEPTPANEQRKNVEISLERAKGLWLTYCLQEPTEDPCK